MVSWNKKKIENTKICCYKDLDSNTNSLNETGLLNQMCIFIDFWKLETENNILYVFQFPSQIEFWEQFLFFVHFGLLNKFFNIKNKKLFLKTEKKGEKQLPNIPLYSLASHKLFFIPNWKGWEQYTHSHTI